VPLHKAAGELEQARADLVAARELAAEDPSFAGEAESIAASLPALEERLAELLIPRDPHDAKDVIVEIKAGEGGEESALFAADLLRMYTRYAERHGWLTEVLDVQDSDLGGVKDVSLAIKTKGVPEGGNGVWSRLKWEGGVHRVQRVPVTESQGRIHTSAAGVLVLPEAEEVDVTVDPNELRIDVFRSSARAANRSTPPTRRSGSPTCRPGSWSPARTRSPSCRTVSRRCGSCGRGCWSPLRSRPTPPPRTPARPRSGRWTARSGSAPTTSRRTGSPTTGSATLRTTSTWRSPATDSVLTPGGRDCAPPGRRNRTRPPLTPGTSTQSGCRRNATLP
jgi:hypothetical protein